MTTLTDAFLADLDELSDGDEDAFQEEHADDGRRGADEEGDVQMLELDSLKADSVAAIATLVTTQRYKDTVRSVEEETAAHGDAMPESWAGPHEGDPTYRLIVACNELAMSMDDEIVKVHNFIKERYRKRFPELEGLVLDPLAYARVVQRIGNEENVIDIDLEDIIPRHVQMTVSVSASTTDGTALTEDELRVVVEACEMAVKLDADRAKVLRFVGSRMALVAPNLSAVCGADVAASLVGAAGGLEKLSQIPACNIQVLGQKRRINAGLSTANVGAHQGHVFSAPIVQNAPPDYRRKIAKLVANKVALLARFDAFGAGAGDDTEGVRVRGAMEGAIEKWMEPAPAVTAKPMRRPDGATQKRRGGKRYRRMKERLAATEMMKQANRLEFGKAEEEYVDGDEMFGLGMLGKGGHGRLKVMQAASPITKKEKLLKKAGPGRGGGAAPAGLLSGTASSLAFSAVQGIELENPDKSEAQAADAGGQRSGTESYFSETSGFRTIRKLR